MPSRQTTAQRRANADRLIAGLSDIPGLDLPAQLGGRGHVWHQFTVLVTDRAPIDRDEFVARLAERGVGSGVYYPRLVFDYDCYRNHPQVVDPTGARGGVGRPACRVTARPSRPQR